MASEVKLYTKPDCHLCHDVAEILARLRRRYPHRLVEVDITEDEELFHRYRYIIPVVEIDDQTLQAPITPLNLRRALAQAR